MRNWVRPELPRRCGGLTGFLRKSRVSHPLVSVTHRTHTGADTGGAPEWVPVNAKIYIDLVNDRAWTEADGEVAIDTLLGTDANTVNGWGATSYEPEFLTANGYSIGESSNGEAALIGTALTLLLSGATVVIRTGLFGGGPEIINEDLAVMAADGANAVFTATNGVTKNLTLFSYGDFSEVIAAIANSGVEGALNCTAITLSALRFEAAMNGSETVSGVLDVADRPGGNPFVAALVSGGVGTYYQSITIYDPLPSTAGLSALSETGVTNTAPSGLALTEWRIASLTSSDGTSVTVPSSTFADNYTGSPYVALLQCNATHNDVSFTDPDGNPLATVTLSSASDPHIVLWNASIDEQIEVLRPTDSFFGAVVFLEDNPVIPDGTTFTLRATDPGGLYVEQEFTITVTA